MSWKIGLLTLAIRIVGCTAAAGQCTGPGSKVLFRETFGTVARPVDITGRTNHQFFAVCPNDGQYTITNRSDTMCYKAWHRILNDHTSTNGAGNFLIVNNAYAAGEFYRQTLLKLCSRSSYEFSAWYINMIKVHRCEGNNPILPNLTIRLETQTGRLISEQLVGLIEETPAPQWRRLSLTFIPPDVDEPVVVKLLNSEKGGCGNDFAFDDFELIQCRPCTDLTRTPNANKVVVPSAFSPNADGVNDRLDLFVGDLITGLNLTIYDRWGSVIFRSDSTDNRWDGTFNGTPCQDGVYAYKVKYEYIDEIADAFTNHTLYGQVLLVR